MLKSIKTLLNSFCSRYKHYCVVFVMGIITCSSSSLLQDTKFSKCVGDKFVHEIKLAVQGVQDETFQ